MIASLNGEDTVVLAGSAIAVRGMLGERLVRRNLFRCNGGGLSDGLVFNDALVKTKSARGTDIENGREDAVGVDACLKVRALRQWRYSQKLLQ